MISISSLYEEYSVISTKNINEFIAFSESTVEKATGRYACAVSALLACSAYYGAYDYIHLSDTYRDLWDVTGTVIDHAENNIIYGTTQNGNIGTGFESYCSSKNIHVTSKTTYSPSYKTFTDCIDKNNMAIVCCGILKEDTNERSGHAMAVEGYATLKKKSSGNTVHTLMIFDGWNEYVRYLNFDFDSWTDTAGVVFNG